MLEVEIQENMQPEAQVSRVAGMVAFARQRKLQSRTLLLNAAASLFGEHDYWSVSVEDVVSAAGVSRVTFYRHFANKTALAIALFRTAAQTGLPRFIAIRDRNFFDRAVVVEWLTEIFAVDRDNRKLLRVFMQANVDGIGFTQSAQGFIGDIIAGLGSAIPAFDVWPGGVAHRHWAEAWLLIYQILDQSHHVAMGAAAVQENVLIDIIADQFIGFLSRPASCSSM